MKTTTDPVLQATEGPVLLGDRVLYAGRRGRVGATAGPLGAPGREVIVKFPVEEGGDGSCTKWVPAATVLKLVPVGTGDKSKDEEGGD